MVDTISTPTSCQTNSILCYPHWFSCFCCCCSFVTWLVKCVSFESFNERRNKEQQSGWECRWSGKGEWRQPQQNVAIDSAGAHLFVQLNSNQNRINRLLCWNSNDPVIELHTKWHTNWTRYTSTLVAMNVAKDDLPLQRSFPAAGCCFSSRERHKSTSNWGSLRGWVSQEFVFGSTGGRDNFHAEEKKEELIHMSVNAMTKERVEMGIRVVWWSVGEGMQIFSNWINSMLYLYCYKMINYVTSSYESWYYDSQIGRLLLLSATFHCS